MFVTQIVSQLSYFCNSNCQPALVCLCQPALVCLWLKLSASSHTFVTQIVSQLSYICVRQLSYICDSNCQPALVCLWCLLCEKALTSMNYTPSILLHQCCFITVTKQQMHLWTFLQPDQLLQGWGVCTLYNRTLNFNNRNAVKNIGKSQLLQRQTEKGTNHSENVKGIKPPLLMALTEWNNHKYWEKTSNNELKNMTSTQSQCWVIITEHEWNATAQHNKTKSSAVEETV